MIITINTQFATKEEVAQLLKYIKTHSWDHEVEDDN
jgi:hypothetical protein